VRLAVCVLIALLATACGSGEPAAGPARYGISVDVPAGVSAEVSRGMIRIATSDLSVVLRELEPAAWNAAEEAYFNDDLARPTGSGGLRMATRNDRGKHASRVAGKACKFPEYVLVAAYGDRYRVEIRVYFGRFHPTEAMLAEADAVPRGLRFPDWGAWELESA
jgi:hypothetical protein